VGPLAAVSPNFYSVGSTTNAEMRARGGFHREAPKHMTLARWTRSGTLLGSMAANCPSLKL
jgi:hypothetical protein